jgi:hypothetical protein
VGYISALVIDSFSGYVSASGLARLYVNVIVIFLFPKHALGV